MAKMHKENSSVMNYIASIHDKLGNGFGASLYTFKKIKRDF